MIFWNQFKAHLLDLEIIEYDVVIPNGVTFSQGIIRDKKIPRLEVRVTTGTAENISTLIFNRKRTSFDIILYKLFKIYPSVPKATISKDLKTYLVSLNKQGLITYRYSVSASLLEKIKFYFLCFVRGYRNRQDIASSNILVVLTKTLVFVLRTYLLLLVLFGVSSLLMLIACLGSQYLIYVVYYITYVISLFLSIAVHESIHLLTYRYITNTKDGYLISKLLSIAFFREKLSGKGGFLVRLLAPLITAFIGGMLFVSTDDLIVKILSSLFICHIINLLPFFGDGYAIINDLLGEEK